MTSPSARPSAPLAGAGAPPATAPGASPARGRRPRWPWIVGVAVLALVVFIALFDWNWLRGPTERYASRSTGRTVTIGHLDVRLQRLTPYVVLTDVTFGNPPWAGAEPMARAGQLMFNVRLLTLLGDEIIVPHLRLTKANLMFRRDAEGRANWKFRENDEPGKRNVNVLTLGLDDAQVAYRDAVIDLAADLHGSSREEGVYRTRIDFAGRWRGNPFKGTADTGSVLSLRGSSEPFPMRIQGTVGQTSIQAEGEVADITRFRHIDADFAISGPSLASLYQTLKVALPETPPYKARGRLKRNGDHYAYEDFKGTIGGSDVAGTARYELRKPRPLLTAELRSQKLALADLGPLVGVKSGATAPSAPAGKGETAPAVNAAGKKVAARGGSGASDGRVFPDSDFNLEKLNAMDADVRLTAESLRLPEQVPLRDFSTRARLDGGVLALDPLHFGFAGGEIVGRIVLDARSDPLAGNVAMDFKRVKLAELFPTLDRLKQSGGSVGAQVRLAGRGNSVADLLGSSNGSVAAGMAGGRVSELAVWLVNLHGGELLPLLFGGDRPTPIRCGAAALDVKNGVGTITTFVFDTEDSLITGGGVVDLKNERVDLTLRPEAKKPGLGSIRGPIHISGGFRDVDFAVAPQSIARGVGAIALGLINPLLALIPLIETGPGEDSNCQAVLAPVKGAVQQSGKSLNDAPAAGEGKGARDEPAPIVNVPPGPQAQSSKGRDRTLGHDAQRSEPAPIVDVDPRKADGSSPRQPPAPVVNVPAKK